MSEYKLELPLPPSANHYWRTAVINRKPVVHVSTEAKEYKRSVGWLAVQAGIRKPIEGRIGIILKLFPRLPKDWEKRARQDPRHWSDGVLCMDVDNTLKVTLDALKNVAFNDDAWVRRIEAERCIPDSPHGRLEVTIYSIESRDDLG